MSILISDFDGTVTRYDFFERIRKRWPFSSQDDPWEKFVADRPEALLVRPELRLARGWLAEALGERGERFHPFERWSQIADQLY